MLVLLCAALLMVSDAMVWMYRGNTTEAGYYIVQIANFPPSISAF